MRSIKHETAREKRVQNKQGSTGGPSFSSQGLRVHHADWNHPEGQAWAWGRGDLQTSAQASCSEQKMNVHNTHTNRHTCIHANTHTHIHTYSGLLWAHCEPGRLAHLRERDINSDGQTFVRHCSLAWGTFHWDPQRSENAEEENQNKNLEIFDLETTT